MLRFIYLLIFGSSLTGLTNVEPSHSVWANDALSPLQMVRPVPPPQAPPFRLLNLEGTPVDSQQLSEKVILLNFWATWCGPCKEEMPSLNRLQQHFSQDQFKVLAITADIQPMAIQSFWNLLHLDMEVLLDESQEVSQQFSVRGLPTTVIIGRKGTILGRAMGPRNWDSEEAVTLIRTFINPEFVE
jgi:thiol-disulfide isomerase/thioredoxin